MRLSLTNTLTMNKKYRWLNRFARLMVQRGSWDTRAFSWFEAFDFNSRGFPGQKTPKFWTRFWTWPIFNCDFRDPV